jgi:hypothetical protein
MGGDLMVVSSQLLAARAATDTDWWLGDLTKAIAYSQLWDVVTAEAPANNEQDFRRDIVFQWKASEMGRAWVRNPRYLCESRA